MSGDGIRRDEGGFTYIGVLIGVAILGAVLAATADVWHTTIQREREKELLFIGNEFRTALASYYTPTGPTCFKVPGRYPKRLEDLLLDDRSPGICRHLRRIYVDPMTGKAEWGLVKLADGQITGVYSLSVDEPIKKAGFRARDAAFENKTRYSDWIFVFTGRNAPAQQQMTTTTTTPPAMQQTIAPATPPAVQQTPPPTAPPAVQP